MFPFEKIFEIKKIFEIEVFYFKDKILKFSIINDYFFIRIFDIFIQCWTITKNN